MQVEFRKNLVKEIGEDAVKEFERRRWVVDPVKNWVELLNSLKAVEK